jgi:transcriptional regulator with XRE-family HTH domain
VKNIERYLQEVGKRIGFLRGVRGISQEHLAHLAQVTQSQISNLESGSGGTLTIIAKVSIALGYDPSQLLDVDFKLSLNKDFEAKKKRNPVAPYLKKIIDFGFLDTPKRVNEIVEFAEIQLNVKLKSSSVSGALEKLVDQNMLFRKKALIGKVFLYYKVS